MVKNKQIPLLHLGENLLKWYDENARDLPFRKTKDPYKIWISEIIFQQTQVKQGLNHYIKFIEKFPDVESLANADESEVMLYWKGLGYYSRAINLHKAARQIQQDFGGVFPKHYEDILKLKGVGKYTASAIASICFGERKPAVDGNLYRVLSRVFADGFDVSQSKAFDYFSQLALLLMPNDRAGDFNQAMMDIGAEICKPKSPKCTECPMETGCLAFSFGRVQDFPVKTKKVKTSDLELVYYFVQLENRFLIRQRKDDFIWKKLYEFPTEQPNFDEVLEGETQVIKHKLTHKNLTIKIISVEFLSREYFENFSHSNNLEIISSSNIETKSFPKPLEQYIYSKF